MPLKTLKLSIFDLADAAETAEDKLSELDNVLDTMLNRLYDYEEATDEVSTPLSTTW